MTATKHAALALELSCRYLQPLLDLAEPFSTELETLLSEWNGSKAELRDETNWTSLRFCEALTEWLADRIGSDRLADEVARAAYSPKALGFLYPLLRAFGAPRIGYSRLPQFVSVLNKVSIVRVLSIGRGHAEVEYRPVTPDLKERSELICRLRKRQLAMGPTLWGLPSAAVEETECQARGGERCLYGLRWAERVPWIGLAIGAIAAFGLTYAFEPIHIAAIIGVSGGLAGLLWDVGRQQDELKRFNEDQNRALTEATNAVERRFVDLVKAKAEVDHQVAERTAELTLTTANLTEVNARLEQLSRVKDEFLANVSHELRTPLTLILGPTQDLLRTAPAETHDHLAIVQRNAIRLNALVDDLLELARMQAGELRLSIAEMSLSDCIARLVEQFLPLAERQHIRLSMAVADIGVIRGDARRLEFAFANLLSNALKFTKSGGEVAIKLTATAELVAVAVSDTGAGIAPDLQPKVFDRFTRFNVVGGSGSAGAGIGLALVKGIVEVHHGSVTLLSEPGKGSTFTVTLPRDQPDSTRDQTDVPVPVRPTLAMISHASGTSESAVTASSPPAASTADAPLVLVVEDNSDVRSFVSNVLRRRFRVVDADCAEAAIDALKRLRPDAIVSDVMMPGLSGYDFARQVKSEPATRLIPVILLTARRNAEWALRGFDSGADDYVAKPFHPDELIARVDVHVRLRQLLDEQVAREKLATLGSLAAGLAHEVRNPVGAILAGLPKVRREVESAGVRPAAREMLDVAIDCANRIDRLVGDVLDLGRPDSDGVQPWNPNEGLDAAIRLLRHRASGSVDIRRRFEFSGVVLARPAAMNQVFVNLLDNALHAVGGAGVVEVATRATDGGALVSFSDSGPGVPAELRSRIFDPFFTTKAVGGGSGLGLHITRRIVQDHGGRIDVLTSDLRGACFRVWLPDGSRA